jgi:ABC-type phosphate transport system substrate-binding protein
VTISSKRLAAAAVGCVAAIGISAPSAFADFASPYTSKCTGDSIVGKGSTFQNAAQAAWGSSWAATGSYCASPFGTAV